MSQFYLCHSIVYDKAGYLETVNTCADVSMKKAIDEVKAQPNYASNGEVVTQNIVHVVGLWLSKIISTCVLSVNSGWLQMLGMIQQQTHFTQRSLVYQEGGGLLSCGFKYYKIHSYNILAPSVFLPVQLCPEKNIQLHRQENSSAPRKYYRNSLNKVTTLFYLLCKMNTFIFLCSHQISR